MLEEIIKDVETAFNATRNIPVTDNGVDALALVRVKLSQVHAKLLEMRQPTTCGNKEEG